VSRHLTSADPEALAAIRRDDMNLVVVERQPDPELQAWVADVASALRPEPLTLLPLAISEHGPYDTRPLVARLPEHPARERLRADIDWITRVLVRALDDRPWLAASLERVCDAKCQKLHADHVRARLVTTYLGPATQWLPEDAVDRRGVTATACCPVDHNARIMLRPGALQSARAGDLVLMKGERWPGNAGHGAVHRSPPLAPGEARVVLTLTWLGRALGAARAGQGGGARATDRPTPDRNSDPPPGDIV